MYSVYDHRKAKSMVNITCLLKKKNGPTRLLNCILYKMAERGPMSVQSYQIVKAFERVWFDLQKMTENHANKYVSSWRYGGAHYEKYANLMPNAPHTTPCSYFFFQRCRSCSNNKKTLTFPVSAWTAKWNQCGDFPHRILLFKNNFCTIYRRQATQTTTTAEKKKSRCPLVCMQIKPSVIRLH